MPTEYVQLDQLYFDAFYNPEKTQFLLNAEGKDRRILNGLGMLCIRALPRSNYESAKGTGGGNEKRTAGYPRWVIPTLHKTIGGFT